jgi:hypothetical protein
MPAFVGTIQGNQLIIKVLVSKPQMPNVSTPDQKSFTALLDTGATITSVTQQVVDALGIQPSSDPARVEHANRGQRPDTHHGPAMARPPRSDMTTVGSVSVPLREDPAGVLRVGAT